MSSPPVELTDDDFTTDAPPGYLSQKHKDRYVPLMITLLFVVFVVQIAAPIFIALVGMPFLVMQSVNQGVPQYTKLAAWDGALWYPSVTMFGGQGSCQLSALDEQGKPQKREPITVEIQPEWLLGTGEHLWAISHGEVAEVFADGSRPIVMHPQHVLSNPSRPFLYEGQPAVFDRDMADTVSPFKWFVFENGEWNEQGGLNLPAPTATLPVEHAQPVTDLEAPADALSSENRELSAEELSDFEEAELLQQSNPSLVDVIYLLQAVATPAGVSVFAGENGTIYHHQGIPLKIPDAPPAQWADWEEVMVGGYLSQTTVVGDQPTGVVSDGAQWNAWRRDPTGWQAIPAPAGLKRSNNNYSAIGTVVVPGSQRTLMICDDENGTTHQLFELKPTGVEKIGVIGSSMGFNDPFVGAMGWYQGAIQVASNVPLLLQILLVTWLMKAHRDPNYYHGRTPVAYASVLRRVIAVVIDTLVVYGPIMGLWYFVFQQRNLGFVETMELLEDDPEQFFLGLLPGMAATGGWLIFCGFVLWLMLAFGGFTIGKFLCGVRVVRTNLEPPGLLRSLIRTIIWPFETFLFSGLAAFTLVAFTENRQRLADLVGGLVVVRAGSLRKALRDNPT